MTTETRTSVYCRKDKCSDCWRLGPGKSKTTAGLVALGHWGEGGGGGLGGGWGVGGGGGVSPMRESGSGLSRFQGFTELFGPGG